VLSGLKTIVYFLSLCMLARFADVILPSLLILLSG